MNLNQITLPVTDMEISTKFYRDLGFTQIEQSCVHKVLGNPKH